MTYLQKIPSLSLLPEAMNRPSTLWLSRPKIILNSNLTSFECLPTCDYCPLKKTWYRVYPAPIVHTHIREPARVPTPSALCDWGLLPFRTPVLLNITAFSNEAPLEDWSFSCQDVSCCDSGMVTVPSSSRTMAVWSHAVSPKQTHLKGTFVWVPFNQRPPSYHRPSSAQASLLGPLSSSFAALWIRILPTLKSPAMAAL